MFEGEDLRYDESYISPVCTACCMFYCVGKLFIECVCYLSKFNDCLLLNVMAF